MSPTRRLAAAGLVALGGVALGAQQNPALYRSSVNIVPVFATVTTRDGAFAGGLTRDDFTIADNGVRREIVSFSDDLQPISVSVILDTSFSMSNAIERVMDAGGLFLGDLLPEDRATVGTLTVPGPPLTADKEALRARLGTIRRDNGSPIWLALLRAMSVLAREHAKRVIVIYTDGDDNSNAYEDTARSRAKSQDLMIYAIGFEGVSLSGGIKDLAKQSGGRAVELKTKDDLGEALAHIADELHHQYLLGFTPALFDGKVHKIEVRVVPRGLTVRARQSYVASAGG
jgi:Ca-activated chloride channel family protein